jgi:arsenate reductase
MSRAPFKTLFLCTGNQARSLFAEYFLRKHSDLFEAYSAGLSPQTSPNPIALEILAENFQIDASDARSKSWEEFRDVHFDFVITLCDDAQETCPTWPGQPIIAHWSSPDPSTTEGDAETIRHTFWIVAEQIRRRVDLLASLPFGKLDALRLEAETHAIGSQ